MKPIKFSLRFRRNFRSRISHNEQLVEAYQASTQAFLQDPELVGDHPLEEPLKDKRAFWMNNDYRMVYQVREDNLLFLDIGTHEQVYQR